MRKRELGNIPEGTCKCSVCKVVKNNTDFQYPYQGLYLATKQGHLGFNRLFYQNPPSYAYIPMAGQAQDVAGKFLLKLLFKKIKIRISLLFSKLK